MRLRHVPVQAARLVDAGGDDEELYIDMCIYMYIYIYIYVHICITDIIIIIIIMFNSITILNMATKEQTISSSIINVSPRRR